MEISPILLYVVAPLGLLYMLVKHSKMSSTAVSQVEQQLALQKETNELLREVISTIKQKE
jgi:hypothetical protein